ncbi:MAG: ketosteroid isomerase-like protein [Actinomycetia bacterium]|nr:ketosteroid isomerase-like protein [Actinomycetes bacterium]
MDNAGTPDSVERYFASMAAHDWVAFRDCLTDDFTRVGPYEDHVFNDPETYVDFLATTLPALESQDVRITRVNRDGDTVHVEVTESVVLPGGTASTVRVSGTFELADDGRIRFVEVFVRRPRAEAS